MSKMELRQESKVAELRELTDDHARVKVGF